MDFGVYADRVFGTPLRVAASTFLLRPAGTPEPATLLAAADFPLIARDTSVTLRGGIAVQRTIGRGREEYFFAAGTYRQFDARVGIAQGTAFGNVNHRARLGAGFHAGRYAVGIAREDGAAGLGASYQFLLSTMFR
jgi:hypothetical protein